MKQITAILIAIIISCGIGCYAQGKVTRPNKQQQSQTSKPKKSTPKVMISDPDGYINGHGYVDLGLPSGLKWATCNVGAASPLEHGDYFAWGETSTKSSYDKGNSLTNGKLTTTLKSDGIINYLGLLKKKYDAANANMGATWRIPTEHEIDELVKKCKWQWTNQGDKIGYKVTGANGNSIFVPAAGRQRGTSLSDDGVYGYYWSSSNNDLANGAYSLIFGTGYHYSDWGYRYNGRSVRAVSE